MQAQTKQKAHPKFYQTWKHIVCTEITLIAKVYRREKATALYTGASNHILSLKCKL